MFNRLKDLYTTYQSNKEFKTLLKNHIINDYKIDKGVVDVFGDVRFNYIPSNENGIIPIKFGKIDGFFDCSFFDIGQKNEALKTLENCPSYVLKDFKCSGNKLTTHPRDP